MTAGRRPVRVAESSFAHLDAQLADERGADGTLSRTDFLLIEFPPLLERFALHFDVLPEMIVGRREYRVVILSGYCVPYLSVTGQLAPDGAVELVALELNLTLPDEADDEDGEL